MPGFGDLVQKAVYLGIGLASYAGEKAGGKLAELRTQVQKLADEMVERGEMTAEEARRFVDDMVKQAQQPAANTPKVTVETTPPPTEPRRIEIVTEEEETTASTTSPTPPVNDLRKQVQDLQEELRRLRQD